MNTAYAECTPAAPPRPDIVTWIHLGDLHMVRPGEQNYRDLCSIVDEIHAIFAGKGISFVLLPGDNADNGSPEAYEAVRSCLDRLQLPWCALVGDHDVQQGTFGNVQDALGMPLYGSFTAGQVRFLRLNCFSEPRPDSFAVDEEQLQWLERELDDLGSMQAVLLMHCYPSDLHQGGERLSLLLRRYAVPVVDMGHTHYNELSNDGHTIYCATRSTGQIEEGPVGYSVLTLDGSTASWHFKRLGTPSLVSITSPADVRLATGDSLLPSGSDLVVRALAWSAAPVRGVTLHWQGGQQDMQQDSGGVWCAQVPAGTLHDGTHTLTATLRDASGHQSHDSVRIVVGARLENPVRAAKDQDNAVGAWPERDILGTQLGPNKNGRQW